MIAFLYRWRVKSGREDDFRAAWSDMTKALDDSGSLGSTLFQAGDGTTYALARWPNEDARNTAFSENLLPEALRIMRDSVVETFEPVRLTEIENLWKQPF